MVSLAFWKCYKMCHQDKRIRRYDITGGGVPQYFLIGSVKISWVAPEDSGGGVQTPNPPVALPLLLRQTIWLLLTKSRIMYIPMI